MAQTNSLTALVERLRSMETAPLDPDAVHAEVAAARFEERSLRPFLTWREDKYARNLVWRSELFDVIVLCWRPGQITPVHDHSGQLGWVRVVRGRLEEVTYERASAAPPSSVAEPAADACAFAALRAPLAETGRGAALAGDVASVDRVRAIHRLGNPREVEPGGGRDEPAVSLHVYSRPHDACLAFDLERGTCRRVELSFDTSPRSAAPRP